MKRIIILLAALAMVFGLAGLAGSARAYTFATLDMPGVSTTSARGINNAGDAGALKGSVI